MEARQKLREHLEICNSRFEILAQFFGVLRWETLDCSQSLSRIWYSPERSSYKNDLFTGERAHYHDDCFVNERRPFLQYMSQLISEVYTHSLSIRVNNMYVRKLCTQSQYFYEWYHRPFFEVGMTNIWRESKYSSSNRITPNQIPYFLHRVQIVNTKCRIACARLCSF